MRLPWTMSIINSSIFLLLFTYTLSDFSYNRVVAREKIKGLTIFVNPFLVPRYGYTRKHIKVLITHIVNIGQLGINMGSVILSLKLKA